MSRKLKWWCVGIGVSFLALIGAMGVNYFLKCLHSVKGNGITKANYAEIKYGMSFKDVEVRLGCPPGDYSTGYHFKNILDLIPLADKGSTKAIWVGNHGYIKVGFNESGRVMGKIFREIIPGGFIQQIYWPYRTPAGWEPESQ